jgi:Flp pilus assembly protein TadG
VALGVFRPRRRTEKGAAALEFALVMPILFVLVFGLIQWGVYFWAYQGGADAARQAARTSATGQFATDCTAFTNDIKDALGNLTTDRDAVDVTRVYTPTDPTRTDVEPNDLVTVTVTYPTLDLNFPFVPFGDGVVTQTAKARVDNVTDQPVACS